MNPLSQRNDVFQEVISTTLPRFPRSVLGIFGFCQEVMDDGTLVCRMLFVGGFPNGGECFADVHAPWGQCFLLVDFWKLVWPSNFD